MTTEVIAEILWGNFARHNCVLSHTAEPKVMPNNDGYSHLADAMNVKGNDNAWREGYNARIRGKAFISCPYSLGTSPDLWASWRRGWTKADILSDEVAFMRVP